MSERNSDSFRSNQSDFFTRGDSIVVPATRSISVGNITAAPNAQINASGTAVNSGPASIKMIGVNSTGYSFTHVEVFEVSVAASTEISRITGAGQNGFAGFVTISVTGHTGSQGNGGWVNEYRFSGTTVTLVRTLNIWGSAAPTLSLNLASDILTISLASSDGTNTYLGVMKIEYLIPRDFSGNSWVVS